MFEVLDLSGRALPQLKDICKQFGIDTKGLGKPELVMAIIGAQTTNPDLASKLTTEFPKKDMAKIEKAEKAEKIEKVKSSYFFNNGQTQVKILLYLFIIKKECN